MSPVLAVLPLAAALAAASPYAEGRGHLAAGRPREALERFEAARGEVPDAWLDLRLAEASARLGRLDEAIGRLERVVDREGASPLGRRALALAARLLFEGGRPAAAADRWRDLAVSDTPNSPRHLFDAGRALEAAAETAAAYRVYGAILWGYPESGFAHRAVGRMDALRADSDGTLPSVDPYEVFLAGKVALERGDPLSAEAKFRTLEEGVIDLAMRDDVLYYAGVAAMRLSRYDEALSRFRALRGDFPRSPFFHDAGLRILQAYIYRGDELNPYLFRLYLREGVGAEAEAVRLDLARHHRARGLLREALDLYAGVQGARAIEARWEEALVYEDLDDRTNWERSTTAVLAQADSASVEADAVLFARARRAEVEGRAEEALEGYTRLAGDGRHPYYLAKARSAVLRLGARRYREGAAEGLWNAARVLAARGETPAAYALWRTIAFGHPETTLRDGAESEARRVLTSLAGWPDPPPSVDDPAAAVGLDDAGRRTLEAARALARAGAPDEAADLLGALPPSPVRSAARARLAAEARLPAEALEAAEEVLAAWPVVADPVLLPEEFGRTLYPAPFAALFRAAADSYALDPLLLLAIARRASGFDPTAVRGVRLGLLGVDPVAAEWAAGEIGLPNFQVLDLFKPEVNIRIGAFLVATAKKSLAEPHLVVAAHWAGPGNVEAWVAGPIPRDEDRFVERIVFPEARAFARDVLGDLRVYGALYPEGIRVR